MADGIKIRELESKTIIDDNDVFVVDSFDQTTPTGTLTQQLTYETLKTQLTTDIGGSGGAGDIGATGIQGPTGFTGATGIDGPTGFTGATGPAGIDSSEGYTLVPPSKTPVVLTVTEENKTSENRFGGSSTCFYINDVEAPFITLVVGKVYRFDTSALTSDFKLFNKDITQSYVEYSIGVTDVPGIGFDLEVTETTRNHIIYDETSTRDKGGTIDVLGSDNY